MGGDAALSSATALDVAGNVAGDDSYSRWVYVVCCDGRGV